MGFEKISEKPLYMCNSWDVKETMHIQDGSYCIETDTNAVYIFFNNRWNLQITSVNIKNLLDSLLFDHNEGFIIGDIVHHHIHEGIYFECQQIYLQVPNDGYIRWLVKAPPTKAMHLIAVIVAEGKTYMKTYTGTTFTNEGTPVPIFNRRIGVSPASESVITQNPTINVLGTKRFDTFIPGGLGPQSSGGVSDQRVETLVLPNNSFLLQLQNVSGQAKDIALNLQWYEHE